MQQNPYFKFLRSWFPLILLGIVVSLVATHVALQDRAPLYRAVSTIQVGRLLDDKSPTQGDIGIVERLIPAYGERARRDPVLEATIDSLGLSLSPENIRGRMLVNAVPQTQLIDIQIVDTDPELAAAIANEIALQVVLQSPSATDDNSSVEFLRAQLQDLQLKITQTQAEAAELEDEILVMSGAAQVFEAQERLDLLNAQIDAWQQTYGTLLNAAEPGQANIVRVASEAVPPSQPLPAQTMLYYGLAIVAGGGLSTLLALGLSTLGRSIGDPREVKELAEPAPVVSIPRYSVPRDGVPVALRDPDSSATSAYRILRNTLRVRHLDHGKVTMAVTSSRAGEGKTTTAANLGIALANSGLSVLLVDANLRNPNLDQVFAIDGTVGFSELLIGDTTIDAVRQPTDHENLWLIGAGGVPDHYTDLLSSVKLSKLVSALSDSADVVIFDTPAIFQEQESQLLAQYLDGVLVIAEAGRVNSDDLKGTLDVLDRAGATVMAVALNKTRKARLSADRIPWTREARLRARAEEQRKRHMRTAQSRHVHSAAD